MYYFILKSVAYKISKINLFVTHSNFNYKDIYNAFKHTMPEDNRINLEKQLPKTSHVITVFILYNSNDGCNGTNLKQGTSFWEEKGDCLL